MNHYSILKTKLVGDLLLVADAKHLTGVYFSDRDHVPAPRRDWVHDPKHPVLRKATRELREYLAGRRKNFSLSLHSVGTDFQRKVWRQIARIPFGRTITYSDLAQRVGAPSAVRAAGTATGKNPLSIIVPCHRVLGKDGLLRGYAGGLDRKKRLLEIETSHTRFELDPIIP